MSFNFGRGWQLAAPALSQPPFFSEKLALMKTTQRNLLDFSLKVLHLIQSQAYDLHHKSSMFPTMPSFWHHWYASWLLEKQQITTILIISRAHTVMLFLVFEYLSPSVLLLDRLLLVLLHGRENSHVATGINNGQHVTGEDDFTFWQCGRGGRQVAHHDLHVGLGLTKQWMDTCSNTTQSHPVWEAWSSLSMGWSRLGSGENGSTRHRTGSEGFWQTSRQWSWTWTVAGQAVGSRRGQEPFSTWHKNWAVVASSWGNNTGWPGGLLATAGETIERGRFPQEESASWPSTGRGRLCRGWKLQWRNWEDERQRRAGRVPPGILKLKHSLPLDPWGEIFTCTPAQMLNWTKVWGRPRICNHFQWRWFAMTMICNDEELQWRWLANKGVGNT